MSAQNQPQNNYFFFKPRNFLARKMLFPLKKALSDKKSDHYQLPIVNYFVPLHRFCRRLGMSRVHKHY